MPTSVSPELTQLTVSGALRLVTCWQLTRRDGFVIRLTDHDHALTFDGVTFSPITGIDASARQKQQGTKTQNLEIRGIVSSDLITVEDLMGGRYRSAEVVEYVVDWRYPWRGKFSTARYWIDDLTATGEMWTANVGGIMSQLRSKVGRRYMRTCDVREFADARCGLTRASFTFTSSVSSVTESRRVFQTPLTNPRAFFNLGKITWTSGSNNGLISEVKNSLASGQIALQLRTAFEISPGDTFSIVAGCDKQFKTCKEKFGNTINFRGFNTMPGNDVLTRSPNAR